MSTRSQNSPTDPDPVARAVADFQAGIEREKNFRLLFDRFHPPVRAFFARRVAAEDCVDLTQETFLRVYRGLDGFRRQSKFGTWLFRITDTTHRKWLRSRRARRHLDHSLSRPEVGFDDHQPVAVDGERSPLEQVVYQETLEQLRQAIDSLSPQMRRCLKLRVYHDLSYLEIADFLEISIQTVKAHLFQARKQLRKILGDTVTGIDF